MANQRVVFITIGAAVASVLKGGETVKEGAEVVGLFPCFPAETTRMLVSDSDYVSELFTCRRSVATGGIR